jgi:xylulokinase
LDLNEVIMRSIAMKDYILGIDIGTTSVKAILTSSDRTIVAETSEAHDLICLHPNWAEENADIWWDNTVKCIKKLRERYPEFISGLKAIGVSGMVPAIVFLDQDGRSLRNTIQQNDSRATEEIDQLKAEIDQGELYARTGGVTNQQHVLPRLLWVKKNEPEIWEKTKCIMGSYDYIIYKLTGVKSLEINWAVESGMLDIHSNEWMYDILHSYNIDPALLPPVNSSMKIVGTVTEEISGLTGLPSNIPVIAGSADHVASSLSAGIISPNDMLIKFGGAGDVLYCTDEIVTSERLYFDHHIIPGFYLLNGCMAASGSLIKWLVKDIMALYEQPEVFKELDRQASEVPPASDGLIVLPYFLGEKTPLLDPLARGVFFGLTLSHSRAHMFRAVLEAVIYGFKHHVDVIEEIGFHPKRIFATNGGAKSKLWCQIAADILGKEIRSYPSHTGSALGVAFLAGMAVDVYHDWNEIFDFLTDYKTYTPNPFNVKVYQKAYSIYRRLYTQLKPLFEEVYDLY